MNIYQTQTGGFTVSKFQAGDQFIVVDTQGHCFAMGSTVVLQIDQRSDGYAQFEGISKNFGHKCGQALSMEQVTPVQIELPLDLVELAKPSAPRVTYLYVVEDEDGVYGKTFDRDHARELKASYGGKKAGVIITAYAAVKEIR
jgi:hypothetical protein